MPLRHTSMEARRQRHTSMPKVREALDPQTRSRFRPRAAPRLHQTPDDPRQGLLACLCPHHPGDHQALLPSLTVLGNDLAPRALEPARSRRLPEWLKRPIPAAGGMSFTRSLVAELGLETVCESRKCPNRSECWTRRTATFMILGGICTRPCGFCRRPRSSRCSGNR